MIRPDLRHAVALAALLLTGCRAPGQALDGPGAAIAVSSAFTPSRHVLAAVSAYTQGDVGRVALTLEDVTATPVVVASASVPAANLGQPITFGHLRHQATYRILADAFALDLATSLTGQATPVVVAVGDDDSVTPVTIVIRLADRPFDGMTTGTFPIATGAYAPVGAPGVASGPSAMVSTVAGAAEGFADGPAPLARFKLPEAIALSGGDVYIADTGNHLIRKVTGGAVTTLAGDRLQPPGHLDGPAASAVFNLPAGLAVDSGGAVYVSDRQNHGIRKIEAGVVTTVAGDGTPGQQDSPATPQFNMPAGLAIDASDVLYVADSGNSVIRTVSPGGVVATLAGLAATAGYANGPATAATFNFPKAVAVGSGAVYVADTFNHVVRKIDLTLPPGDPAYVTTLAGPAPSGGSPANPAHQDGPAASAQFWSPKGLALDGQGHLYVSEENACDVRRIDLSTLMVTTVAGSLISGFADGPARSARFNSPFGLAVDPSGALYVSDQNNARIRKVQFAP